MNHYGNDDQAFEQFRLQKTRRRRDRRIAGGDPAAAVAKETLRAIEEGEQREAQELRLRREMVDFVRDTTKLAAGVLNEVSDEEDRKRSRQIRGEMRDFFRTALFGTEDLLEVLYEKYGDQVYDMSMRELEAHMAQLDVEQLDRYRSEGSEEAARLHLGQALPPAGTVRPQNAQAAPVAEAPELELLPEEPEVGPLEVPEHTEAPIQPSDGLAELEDPVELASIEDFDDSAWMPGTAPVPLAYARLLQEPTKRKRVLAILVQAGLLTRDEARNVYLEAKQLLAAAR